jgi:hypothetical protein
MEPRDNGVGRYLSPRQWGHDKEFKEAWRHANGLTNTSDGHFDEWEGCRHSFDWIAMTEKMCKMNGLERKADGNGVGTSPVRPLGRIAVRIGVVLG